MSPSKNVAPTQAESGKQSWPAGLALLLIVVVTYMPVLSAGFIWDDDDYVTENEQLTSLEGLGNIWFEIGATPQYYPLVHSTFWLEYQLWGLDPAGFHFDNVLLHALAALLLWRVLKKLNVPGAWFAAALFAIHPVEVESVAWVTERKNVLSGFMYLAAALAYFRFTGADGSSSDEERSWKHYRFALLLFVGALLSKTVTASFPAALLVVFWWKRGSLRLRDFKPLVPFFVLGVGLGGLTAYLEKTQVGAEGADWTLSVIERFMVAGRIALFYLTKIVWPEPLVFFYERWDVSSSEPLQYFFPLTVAAILAACWFLRDRIGRGYLAAFLFFGGTLAPALGFIDVYPMRFSYVADHFQYLAGIGIFVLIGAGFQKVADTQNRFGLRNAGLALIYIVLGAITMNQLGSYQSLEILWRDTMRKNPKAWIAHNNLGVLLKDRGDIAEAETCYREAISLLSTFVDARNNLGTLMTERGDHVEATRLYEEAWGLGPGNSLVGINLAASLRELGRLEEALDIANRAIELASARAVAHGMPAKAPYDYYYKRGTIYWLLRRPNEAGVDYDYVISLVPNHDKALASRALAYAALGDLPKSIEYFERALELVPGLEQPLQGLCRALMQSGDNARAIPLLKELRRRYPNNVFAPSALQQLGE